MEKSYTVGELKKLIRESSSEFEPVLGPKVKSDNKKNNEKSYEESEKRAKDYDGGLKAPAKKELGKRVDPNRTTLDYNPVNEPDESYKKKVKAQLKGYTSELEEKNGIEKGGAEFDNDGKLEKFFSDARDEREENDKKIKKSGLAARTLPDKVFDKNHLNENSLKPKRLIFKHSKFLNESQALSKIPEEYKREGQIIYMKDKFDNEYIVECTKSDFTGNIETTVIGYNNQKLVNEQVNRMWQIFDYKSKDTFGRQDNESRVNENTEFKHIMDLARGK